MKGMYFWKDGAVIEFQRALGTIEVRNLGLLGCFCVDTNCLPGYWRYGVYYKDTDWNHKPFDEFPPEFRVHLLLLGVS